ncbi:hypothetical protein L6R53_13660 [Myxococcota bacterium]|nr:hypothetical protein [Myxococcota bacterium]
MTARRLLLVDTSALDEAERQSFMLAEGLRRAQHRLSVGAGQLRALAAASAEVDLDQARALYELAAGLDLAAADAAELVEGGR